LNYAPYFSILQTYNIPESVSGRPPKTEKTKLPVPPSNSMVGGTGLEPCPLSNICIIFKELKANQNQFTGGSHFLYENLN